MSSKHLSFWAIALLLMSCYAFTPHTKDSTMNNVIQEKVQQFATATAQHDVKTLQQLLNPEFRAIVNQYPKPEQTTLLPKKVYLDMIGSKKIGGKMYTVRIDQIVIKEHSATAIATFKGKNSNMHVTLLLVQDLAGVWTIISDMALIQ